MLDKLDAEFAFGREALDVRAYRQELLSSNIANADTPGYLARDVDFKKTLAAASGTGHELAMSITQPGQIDPQAQSARQLAYRVPSQPSMDGNTVDTQVEQANFAANGVHYQASLSFITAQIHMLRTAITGGQG